jgi:hypothetical protein
MIIKTDEITIDINDCFQFKFLAYLVMVDFQV